MSDIGTYSFLPWLRRGVANLITAAPGGATRASIGVDLTLTGDAVGGGTTTLPVHRDVELYGPGDVIGLDARSIVRTEPRAGITDFEPNYLPFVEFYDEDLPWRYTPAPPDGSKRLRPWLALVVLADDEFTEGTATGKPLPFVIVGDSGVFPAAGELWAWAHVHVNGGLDAAGEVVSDDMAQVLPRFDEVVGANPDLGLSRLLCPRRLRPNTAYHAFVMPAFESGRLAGLGLDPGATPAAMQPAWGDYANRGEPPHYCYYHRWQFRTGTVGDFEYLVRLLKPRRMDPHVGQRDMDVRKPLPGLPGIDVPGLGGMLRLGGALRVPQINLDELAQAEAERYENWDTPFPHPFQRALADLVELGDDYAAGDAADPDPVVTPPLYGRWHAQTSRLLEATAPQLTGNWVHELNLDPRFRATAGFGTAVVQDNQETYLAAAWDQVGAVQAANKRIRLGQLAREVAASIHRRHLAAQVAADPGRVLAITAPVHPRIVHSGVTVAHGLAASLVAKGPLSAAMRRISRPGSTVVRALTRRGDPPRRLLAAIAAQKATAARPKTAPPGVPTSAVVLRALSRHRDTAAFQLALDERKPELVTELPRYERFTLSDPGKDVPTMDPTATDSRVGARYKTGIRGNAELIRASAEAGVEPGRPGIAVDGLAKAALGLVDPDVTVPRRVLAGLTIPARFRPVVVASFREVMAYPEIDLPMYRPLADKSSELFLPNLNLIPPDSISMLETNQRFIEAYLVGLNHEMARELLWREYPTDQQGSYFRQFWDPSHQLPVPGETGAARRERLRDIPPLHQWPLTSTLGEHDHRELGSGTGGRDEVVLVIRGDLLKRFPTAVIYAQKAKWRRTADGAIDPGAERELDDLTSAEELDPPLSKLRMPLFGAKVEPDISFLGFDLTAEEARGQDPSVPDPDAGWFFVLRERPGEPRFGLDIARDGNLNVWNDLAWDDVAPGVPFIPAGPTAATRHLAEPTGADAEKHDQWTEDRFLHWGPDLNASEVAYILYQAPVLVAVHAGELIGHE
ncbi:hypothetical protein SLUN_00785 [Streptomyces lunaelactis]|uniref:Uncharacterized protein n=1 Tax=Streptomyces lunaelactis TaxID=1535768 RepID=A0A2R4SVW3_9ACTN|nr:hypothetical protein [Streptomyces lunaelactis]AVZ71005.1 hypothetical protein SLUN_00785 [Streptomyces lunaelactis]NUK25713.1 hypothetical protein [Streptomyces lunaelactis]NUK86073.1 hypothetical protein [Streptomyces lunaelactis]